MTVDWAILQWARAGRAVMAGTKLGFEEGAVSLLVLSSVAAIVMTVVIVAFFCPRASQL